MWRVLKRPDPSLPPGAPGESPHSLNVACIETSLALNHLNYSTPQFLWVSFGDPDEYAHRGDWKSYLKSIQLIDIAFKQILEKYQGEWVEIILSTDHGRSSDWTSHGSDDKSGQTWLMVGNSGCVKNYDKVKKDLKTKDIFYLMLDN